MQLDLRTGARASDGGKRWYPTTIALTIRVHCTHAFTVVCPYEMRFCQNKLFGTVDLNAFKHGTFMQQKTITRKDGPAC